MARAQNEVFYNVEDFGKKFLEDDSSTQNNYFVICPLGELLTFARLHDYQPSLESLFGLKRYISSLKKQNPKFIIHLLLLATKRQDVTEVIITNGQNKKIISLPSIAEIVSLYTRQIPGIECALLHVENDQSNFILPDGLFTVFNQQNTLLISSDSILAAFFKQNSRYLPLRQRGDFDSLPIRLALQLGGEATLWFDVDQTLLDVLFTQLSNTTVLTSTVLNLIIELTKIFPIEKLKIGIITARKKTDEESDPNKVQSVAAVLEALKEQTHHQVIIPYESVIFTDRVSHPEQSKASIIKKINPQGNNFLIDDDLLKLNMQKNLE